MKRKESTRKGQRGSIMVLWAVMIPVLILIVGLAIDVTMLYVGQGQLQTAVDGAANGAARLVGSNANESEIANEFVQANMKNGSWLTNSNSLAVTNFSLTTTQTTATANVSASVNVPLFFMRLLGPSASKVNASGTATLWTVQPCTLTYPYGSAPALSSVQFSESITLQGWGPTFVLPHGKIIAWYNDEHALTLGVYKVYVTDAGGATTLTDYSNSFTFFTGALGGGSANSPLPVGTTATSGDQSGTDLATWDSNYNYQFGRPQWPALYITDLSQDASSVAGDWQQGGTGAIPPNAVYGTWKGTIKCVNYSNSNVACPPGGSGGGGGAKVSNGHPGITFALDADPSANCNGGTCNGVPDTPSGGWTQKEKYGAELVWFIDSLGLLPGHAYRLQLMLHDGDQHGSGGDAGEGCMIAKY